MKKVNDLDLKKIQEQGWNDAFSTQDHTSGQIPTIIQDLKKDYRNHRHDYALSVQKILAEQEQVIHQWESIEDPRSRKKTLESKLASFLNFNCDKHIDKIKNSFNVFKKREKNYLEFQRQHNRILEPVRSDNKKVGWFIVFGLFIVEVLANFVLFSEVTGSNTSTGQLRAMTLSAAQSFVNVVSGFMVGSMLWGKVLYGQKLTSKIYASIVSVIHALIIIWMNLAIGLWRGILTYNSTADEELPIVFALTPFQHFSYFNGDMPSILVSLVGLVFAIIAYFDGWFSDDPFPHYGNRYRELNTAKKDLESAKKTVYDFWDTLVKSYGDITAKFIEDSHKLLDDWNKATNRIEKEFVDYKALISNMEKNYNLAKDTYETSFNKANPDQKKKIKFPASDILFSKDESDPEYVFRDASTYHLKDAVRIKEFKKKKSDYSLSFDKLTAQWDAYKKSTTEKLNKMVQAYDI